MLIIPKNLSQPCLEKKNTIWQNFRINLTFIVYLDLCLLRGWKGLRIIIDKQTNNYFVVGINPTKKKNNFEIFFPIKGKSKLNLNKISKLLIFLNRSSVKKYLKTINLAFIDYNSTIAYYRLAANLNKTSGPLGRN